MVYLQVFISKAFTFLLPILVLLSSTAYSDYQGSENHIKSATFLSEKFELGAGRIAEKNFLDIEIPRGHIGVKSFDAELVDDEGNSVPLYETYLHHWFTMKYFLPKNVSRNSKDPLQGVIYIRNAGTCKPIILPYHWGKGVESRGTPSKLLDPFAYELGNPKSIPLGYDEKWLFNILAIDTRGAKQKKSCTQCRCNAYHLPKDFYNRTTSIDGKLLTPAYKGGFHCCQDGFQCKLKKGYQAPTRKLSLKYKITWVDWNEFQVPVKFYILDATDRVTRNGSQIIHDCRVSTFFQLLWYKISNFNIFVTHHSSYYLLEKIEHQRSLNCFDRLIILFRRQMMVVNIMSRKLTYRWKKEVISSTAQVICMQVLLTQLYTDR